MDFKKKAGLALALAAIFTTGGANMAFAGNETFGDTGAITGGMGGEGSTLKLNGTAAASALGLTDKASFDKIEAVTKTVTTVEVTGTNDLDTDFLTINGTGGDFAINSAADATQKVLDVTIDNATLVLAGSGELSDGSVVKGTNPILTIGPSNKSGLDVQGDYQIDQIDLITATSTLDVAGLTRGETANLDITFLNATGAGDITVGSTTGGAGNLSIGQALLTGSVIFADPAFGDNFGDNTSSVHITEWGGDVTDPTTIIDGKLMAGQNSFITLGGTKENNAAWMRSVVADVEDNGLIWGDEITAAFGFTSGHEVSQAGTGTAGSILVDGALTVLDGTTKTFAVNNNVAFANESLTVFDLGGPMDIAMISGDTGAGVHDDILLATIGGFSGTTPGTNANGNAYVYFDNAHVTTTGYTIIEDAADIKIGAVSVALGAVGDTALATLIDTKAVAAVGKFWTEDTLIMSSDLLDGELFVVKAAAGDLGEDLVLRVSFDPDSVGEFYSHLSSGTAGMITELYEEGDNNTFYNSTNGNNYANSKVSGAAGIAFLSRLTDNRFMPNHTEAAAVLEGAAQIAVAAGVPTVTNSIIGRVSTLIVDHANMLASTQPSYGNEAGAFGLWVTPFYGMSNVDGVEAGAFEAGYDMNYGGAALGFDYNLNEAFRMGLALNLGSGDSDSDGDFNDTTNDFDFFGVGLYGTYSNGAFGVTADVGYTTVDNDIEQDVPGALQMGQIKSSVDSDAWTIGLTGQYRFTTSETFNITPHLGLRFTQISTDDAKVKIGGSHIMDVATDDQNLFQVPVGVEFSSNITTAGGWTITPSLDLGAVFTAGDTDVDSRVRMVGTNLGGMLTANDVQDNVAFTGKLGVKAGMDNGLSLGLDYGLLASGNQTDHQFSGMLRFEF